LKIFHFLLKRNRKCLLLLALASAISGLTNAMLIALISDHINLLEESQAHSGASLAT